MSRTTRISMPLHSLVAMLIVSLLVTPFIFEGGPPGRPDSTRRLTLASPPSLVQTNRGSQRVEDTKQYTAADSLFVLVRVETPALDRHWLSTPSEPPPYSSFLADRQSGRAPPPVFT